MEARWAWLGDIQCLKPTALSKKCWSPTSYLPRHQLDFGRHAAQRYPISGGSSRSAHLIWQRSLARDLEVDLHPCSRRSPSRRARRLTSTNPSTDLSRHDAMRSALIDHAQFAITKREPHRRALTGCKMNAPKSLER